MNGHRVGVWFWSRTGTPGFRYDDAWRQSPNARALSVSLPLPAAGGDVMGPAVEHYFDNLLAAVGHECAGAVQLVPDGTAPPRTTV